MTNVYVAAKLSCEHSVDYIVNGVCEGCYPPALVWNEHAQKEPNLEQDQRPVVAAPTISRAPVLADILAEREERYGGFAYNAAISQEVKTALRKGRQWDKLSPQQKEALEMIANKLCRIVAGKADYRDSWDDIAGYATLVADGLEKRK